MIYRNYGGVEHALDLISHGKVSHKAFSFDDEDERDLLGPEGTDLANHRRHHLGIDDGRPHTSPKAHRYPFAKGGKLYARALHGIRNAAHDAGHEDIRDIASMLLGHVKVKEDPSERDATPDAQARHIVKDGGKYRLYTKDGHKLLSVHDTKEGALEQEEAIKAHEADEAGGRSILPAREVRSFPTEVKVRDTDDGPVIEGYGIVYDKDSQVLTDDEGNPFIERIDPGAMARLLASNPDVRALGNHDPNQLLGRTKSGTLALRSDDVGVHYTIRPPRSAIGDHHVESTRRGDMDGSSFSFNVAKGGDRWDRSGPIPVRTVTAISDCYDIGPVTFPAYLDTTAASRSLAAAIAAAEGRTADPEASRRRLRRQRLRALPLLHTHLRG